DANFCAAVACWQRITGAGIFDRESRANLEPSRIRSGRPGIGASILADCVVGAGAYPRDDPRLLLAYGRRNDHNLGALRDVRARFHRSADCAVARLARTRETRSCRTAAELVGPGVAARRRVRLAAG